MIRRLGTYTLIALSLALGGCGGEAASTPAGEIAFAADPNGSGDYQLYVVHADGSGLRKLTQGAWDEYPVWSPDGTRIAFTRTPNPEVFGDEVWVVDADGTNARRLAEGNSPAWSPDGSTIAFNRPVGAESSEIRVIQADGTDDRVLVRNAGTPSWSPDGEQLVFEYGRSQDQRIAVIRSDGSDLRPLTDGPGDSCTAWSPTGEEIVFCKGGSGDLYVMTADGADQRRVTMLATSETFAFIDHVSWSPDAKQIAFSMLVPPMDDEVIAVVDLDGSDVRTLSPGSASEFTEDTSPEWSPNGESIAFANLRAGAGELWVMNGDGSERRRLTGGPFTEPDAGIDWAAASG